MTPTRRSAARALVLDPDDRLLLLRVEARAGVLVWIAPGGGIEAGEEPSDALERELAEELGHEFEVRGEPVWLRRHVFEFEGRWFDQDERYFVLRAGTFDPPGPPPGDEGRVFRGFRWWSAGEIAASDELFAPRRLGVLLRRLLVDGRPATPFDVGV